MNLPFRYFLTVLDLVPELHFLPACLWLWGYPSRSIWFVSFSSLSKDAFCTQAFISSTTLNDHNDELQPSLDRTRTNMVSAHTELPVWWSSHRKWGQGRRFSFTDKLDIILEPGCQGGGKIYARGIRQEGYPAQSELNTLSYCHKMNSTASLPLTQSLGLTQYNLLVPLSRHPLLFLVSALFLISKHTLISRNSEKVKQMYILKK